MNSTFFTEKKLLYAIGDAFRYFPLDPPLPSENMQVQHCISGKQIWIPS